MDMHEWCCLPLNAAHFTNKYNTELRMVGFQWDTMFHFCVCAAFTGVAFAAQQYRDVGRPGSGWFDLSGSAGSEQKQPSHYWPGFTATTGQFAGATHHR